MAGPTPTLSHIQSLRKCLTLHNEPTLQMISKSSTNAFPPPTLSSLLSHSKTLSTRSAPTFYLPELTPIIGFDIPCPRPEQIKRGSLNICEQTYLEQLRRKELEERRQANGGVDPEEEEKTEVKEEKIDVKEIAIKEEDSSNR